VGRTARLAVRANPSFAMRTSCHSPNPAACHRSNIHRNCSNYRAQRHPYNPNNVGPTTTNDAGNREFLQENGHRPRVCGPSEDLNYAYDTKPIHPLEVRFGAIWRDRHVRPPNREPHPTNWRIESKGLCEGFACSLCPRASPIGLFAFACLAAHRRIDRDCLKGYVGTRNGLSH
jgi:hypothetical protein